jgi:hypothetical protein
VLTDVDVAKTHRQVRSAGQRARRRAQRDPPQRASAIAQSGGRQSRERAAGATSTSSRSSPSR